MDWHTFGIPSNFKHTLSTLSGNGVAAIRHGTKACVLSVDLASSLATTWTFFPARSRLDSLGREEQKKAYDLMLKAAQSEEKDVVVVCYEEMLQKGADAWLSFSDLSMVQSRISADRETWGVQRASQMYRQFLPSKRASGF